jgi:DNA repair protein RadC
MNSISQWPETERPRERLLRLGAAALSDAELLAILLRSGTRGMDAIRFGRQLVNQYGSLRGLFAAGAAELSGVKGLGPAKTASLLAVQELARRQAREQLAGRLAVRDASSVADYFQGLLRDRKKEVFKVVFLDRGNRLLGEQDYEGTVDQAPVHPREVVKAALDRHASAVILVHNHPSGRTEPSAEDEAVTDKVARACGTVGIDVLDHIIVGAEGYFSFREHGMID